MKLFSATLAVTLAFLGLGSAALANEIFQDGGLHRELFSQYTKKYGKSYGALEYEKRYAAFLKNFDRVRSHNQQANEGKFSFTLEMNHLADWTDEEYRSLLGYRRKKSPSVSAANEFTSQSGSQAPPSSWDWRTHNVVGPVKNQGQCGSCWAFSAVASMEGLFANKTGKIVSLSEQELVDCCDKGEDDCQHGGEMQHGFSEVIEHHKGKIDTEEDYAYTAQSLKQCKADDSKAVGQFTGYTNVTSGDEQALLVAAFERPVVAVAIDASSFLFQLYHSGVFDWPMCKNNIDGLDHGVAVVGYGSEGGSDYWIVRNSWGDSWGQSGYIWMSRNKKNQCGVATDASFPLWS